MTGLAQPATAALDAPNDLLWVKLNHGAIRLDRIVRSLSHLLCRALLLELALGVAQSGGCARSWPSSMLRTRRMRRIARVG